MSRLQRQVETAVPKTLMLSYLLTQQQPKLNPSQEHLLGCTVQPLPNIRSLFSEPITKDGRLPSLTPILAIHNNYFYLWTILPLRKVLRLSCLLAAFSHVSCFSPPWMTEEVLQQHLSS